MAFLMVCITSCHSVPGSLHIQSTRSWFHERSRENTKYFYRFPAEVSVFSLERALHFAAAEE